MEVLPELSSPTTRTLTFYFENADPMINNKILMLQYFKDHSNNEENRFDVNDFYYRIKKLEKICNKENVDGILIVNGVDGRDN